MCVDYTDMNESYPKYYYTFHSIDQLINAALGFHIMSFMNAFLGYNQIWMAEKDKEKIAFITDRGTYCYKVMSFRLKNASVTYQRIVNEVFKTQLDRNKAYVDNMMVKSMSMAQHITDLQKTFTTI